MIENKKVILRKLKKEDMSQIKEICNLSFPKEDEVFLIVDSMKAIEHFYVAEFTPKQQVVGFVIFGIFSIKTTHLMILAIHPDYQRQGIGTLLLERVIETTKLTPIKSIRLEVRTTNEIAIAFYQKFGFNIVTTIENYYNTINGDAYLMIKKLNDE